MSTTAPHTPGEFGEPPARPAPARGPAYYLGKGLKALASLQLTVVLFALGILLIFFGTLAQLDFGIWTVVDKYFWSWVVHVPFDMFNKFLGVFWKERFPPGGTWEGTFPFPAGKLLGGLMLVNLLAAHAMRFRLTWKRAGVFLIHGGLILLFVGEFITREYAVEQRMTIKEGESTNYAEDMRHCELVFLDRSDPKHDTVSVVPQNVLKSAKGRISHPDLPVDVEVIEFQPNSGLTEAEAGGENRADSGFGKRWISKKLPEVSGVDPNQTIDLPAAYVKLYKKGTDEALGTYLASVELNMMGSDKVEVDGKKLDVMLRFKRYYKPFKIHLDKFRFDRYMGTEKAKNFSSDVRLFDAEGKLVLEQRISMNDPLRYDGETFYQADFDKKTETTTVLQVVKNPGWVLPYISCVVVGLGLALHFGIYLVTFLRRGTPTATVAGTPAVVAPTSRLVRLFPWLVLGVMGLYLLSIFGRMNPPKEPIDYRAAGRMSVLEGGRVKPLDTVARIHLRTLSGREEFEDENRKMQPAIRWYLEVLAGGNPNARNRAAVWDYKVIRVDNEAVLDALKLDKKREGFRYSMNELGGKIDTIVNRLQTAQRNKREGKKSEVDDAKFLELYQRMERFMTLAQAGAPKGDDPQRFEGPQLVPVNPEGTEWKLLYAVRKEVRRETSLIVANEAQKRLFASKKLDTLTPEDEQKLVEHMQGIDLKATTDPVKRDALVKETVRLLRMNPASINDEMRTDWTLGAVALLSQDDRNAVADLHQKANEELLRTKYPAAATWEKIIAATRDNKSDEFSAAVEEYRTKNTANVPDTSTPHTLLEKLLYPPFNAIGRNKVEVTFNRFAPFYQCTGLYVLVAVLTFIGFTQQAAGRPQWASALRQSAVLVLLLALAVHSVALLARMYIMERAGVFVTNLYSSAIFIGWGAVLVGLLLELIFRMGVGNLLAATIGLATCIVGHNLAVDDTLEMMQAVLDTNFWLATHVTTITLGYTATFVAGALGALYVAQLLAAVVRDSFLSKGEPTVGELLAFGVATTGSVAIPVFMLWFATSALDKFELVPSFLLQTAFGIVLALGVIYAIGLMLLRVSTEGADAQGKPLAGRIPGLAQPLVAMGLTPERGKIFGQMVYGVVCFATLLSFVGTVLGGIWADQSWGRFWGWDPKENGAVLIVLWNSLILHARWCGLVKDRGVAVLAIFGNVITAWSWFGTNQLQIGLHSYGFDTRLADGCFNFWVSQMMILALGLIPARFWPNAARRALATASASAAAPAPAPSATDSLAAPTAAPNGSPSAVPQPHPNGNGNGHPNGAPNGHPRRDKKKHGKRR